MWWRQGLLKLGQFNNWWNETYRKCLPYCLIIHVFIIPWHKSPTHSVKEMGIKQMHQKSPIRLSTSHKRNKKVTRESMFKKIQIFIFLIIYNKRENLYCLQCIFDVSTHEIISSFQVLNFPPLLWSYQLRVEIISSARKRQCKSKTTTKGWEETKEGK